MSLGQNELLGKSARAGPEGTLTSALKIGNVSVPRSHFGSVIGGGGGATGDLE